MILYTDPTKVQHELRTTTAFTSSTYPSLQDCNRWISEAQNQVEALSGRIWGQETVVEYFDYAGQDALYTSKAPLYSVTSLKYNTTALGSGAAVWVTKTEDTDYAIYDKKGKILLLPGFAPKDGPKRFELTYVAGFETVPERIQMLVTKMVAHRILTTLIHQNVNEGNDGGSISVGSIQIVEPASYGVNSYTKLGDEVKEELTSLTQGSGVYRYN